MPLSNGPETLSNAHTQGQRLLWPASLARKQPMPSPPRRSWSRPMSGLSVIACIEGALQIYKAYHPSS